jgi:hypothetical protein
MSASQISKSPPTPRSRKQMLTPNLLTVDGGNGRPEVETAVQPEVNETTMSVKLRNKSPTKIKIFKASPSSQSSSSENDSKSKTGSAPTRRSSRK